MKEFHIFIKVEAEDDWSSATVTVSSQEPPEFAVLMVATENLMNAAAMESNAGYEEALLLLCEGARKTNALIHRNKTITPN